MSEMEANIIQEEIVEYRVYKEKPYLNSERDPFGLTINGKAKEYVQAHQTFKGILKKGKQLKIDNDVWKILGVKDVRGILNSIVEVSENGKDKGNVELKVYNPSVNKKKGATIELRKISGFEYSHVEILKRMITTLLDGFIAGKDMDEIIKNGKGESFNKSKVTSKPALFSCAICNWQTKFASALKSHMTRIHRPKSSDLVKCDQCDFQTQTILLLDDHTQLNHRKNNKRAKESISPTSSPPPKKQDGSVKAPTFSVDDSEVEMIDLDIEEGAKDFIQRMLENRITELEEIVQKQEMELKVFEFNNKEKLNTKRQIPQQLSSVKVNHLPLLNGYKLRFQTKPNGACLDSCLAVHVYEDEAESFHVKSRINNHVADHWDNYYRYKIPLPYEETVGVGKSANFIKKTTRAEMLEFLRSKESLMV